MSRIDELRLYMEKEKLDSFYIKRPASVRYISGYKGEDSFLLITQKSKYFITDARYIEEASYECPEYEIVNWRTKTASNIGETLNIFVGKDGLKNIGFEEDYITFAEWRLIQDTTKAELVATRGVIENQRSVKSLEEIDNLRTACDISSKVFEKILKDIREGVTEKEIASKLSHYMVMEGADTKPYGGIVISGAKTSLLHGIPDDKPIKYGDFVLLDYGCQYNGYMSDMTRTVVLGKANSKQKEVYELCRKMTTDTKSIMKPGITGQACYEASIEAIRDTEYFQYHYPSIGHGIGLFVHEKPFIGNKCNDVLQENNILTVEPGIYIPGWGGVRIEDQIRITSNGYEDLINATHKLIEL